MKTPGKTFVGTLLFLALVGTAALHAARFAAALSGVPGSAAESWGIAAGLASASVAGALLAMVARHGDVGPWRALQGAVARVGVQGGLLFLAGSATGAIAWAVAGALGHPDDVQRASAALTALATIASGGVLFAGGERVHKRWAADVAAALSFDAPDVDAEVLAEAIRAEDWPRVARSIAQATAMTTSETDLELVSRAEALVRVYEPREDGWPADPGSIPRHEVDRVARLLMAEWERVEGKPINVSYIATFADLARVVAADQARTRQEHALGELLVALSSRIQQYARIQTTPPPAGEAPVAKLLARAETMAATFKEPPRLLLLPGGSRIDTAEVAAILRELADEVRRG